MIFMTCFMYQLVIIELNTGLETNKNNNIVVIKLGMYCVTQLVSNIIRKFLYQV